MKISNKIVYRNLDRLFEESVNIPLSKKSKWVIFSDLHMGDGGSTDDFRRNHKLFETALEKYYLDNGFSLFLNGDVEELQRFKIRKIHKYWKDTFKLFERFNGNGQVLKTIGNHDLELQLIEDYPFDFITREAFTFDHTDGDLFLFHGHQASKKYQRHNELIGFTLKYFANPLGIKSYSVSHDSRKQYNIEKRVYHYSTYKKRASIIGHTHRPLFESLHKVERLKYMIEQLCREYSSGERAGDPQIKIDIKNYKKELKSNFKEASDHNFQNYVYNSIFHIPCLFNSGTVIGKRGMTCLEIEDDNIRLVHWFDKNISKKYLQKTGYQQLEINNTGYYRMLINEESLKYIFTRIKFLS